MTIALAWLLAVIVVIAFIRGCRDEPEHTKYDEGAGFKWLREHPLPEGTQASEERIIWPDEQRIKAKFDKPKHD